jgi:hypothetical protein
MCYEQLCGLWPHRVSSMAAPYVKISEDTSFLAHAHSLRVIGVSQDDDVVT